MATLMCELPGNNKTVEEADRALAIELLKLLDIQAHSIVTKYEGKADRLFRSFNIDNEATLK